MALLAQLAVADKFTSGCYESEIWLQLMKIKLRTSHSSNQLLTEPSFRFNALTEQLVALTAARGAPQHQNPHSRRVNAESGDDVESEDGDNPFAVLRPQRKELAVVLDTFRRWESGFKLDIPEFKGCSQPDEFLDWVAAVEEILEFKEVPLDKRVSLVATKFRVRAAAWWQQLKQTRERQGKEKIRSWEKLLKHMRASFLPHNYTRSLYQQLQNLRQGSKSVDDYTQEFYQLLARNDLSESQDQLVSRYIGGMREQFQDALNFYDPVSVSEAHQKALTLEKQAGRKSGFQFGNITGSRPIPLVNNQTTIGKPLAAGQANRAPINSNTARCFKCGEPGHRMADCKRNERFGKGLFVDAGDNEIEQPSEEQAAQYDEDGVEEEFVQGDYGPLLRLYQAEFAYNRSVNRSSGFSPFFVTYGFNPRAPIDLAPVPDLKRPNGKAEDLISGLQAVHKTTVQHLEESFATYKQAADKKRRAVEFEVGDFVWVVLAKDRFPAGEYNKLAARKIGPLEILEKINPNAYKLKLPSHIRISATFNVKHLIPYRGDSSDEESVNLRANSLQPGEDDADLIA
ncbi:hypothetical protein RHSIM_Rhsim07G0165900 [Rhododendron simsii]|uniref:CCHC-type domain-containing protein n=1 Tax=Rhododendron simsii TaxID=118357 RepID=A0A834GPC1_RHOSS|nr:hypothetical protein RHSIM_Rhsim07G0165900 [Rhododendron simsii]